MLISITHNIFFCSLSKPKYFYFWIWSCSMGTLRRDLQLCHHKVFVFFLLNFVVLIILKCICEWAHALHTVHNSEKNVAQSKKNIFIEKRKGNKTSQQNMWVSFNSAGFFINSICFNFGFIHNVCIFNVAHFHNCAQLQLHPKPCAKTQHDCYVSFLTSQSVGEPTPNF